MSRPTLETLNSSESGWLARLNSNFGKIMDTPFPMALYADAGALGTAANAKLYKDCFALVGASGSARIYSSDGTTWSEWRLQLANIADMNPGVSTIADIKNAHNALLADMQAKGYMA